MKKHVLARALALVMSLSLLSSTALAAVPLQNALDESGNWKTDQSDALNEETNVYEYYLDGDMELDKTLTFSQGQSSLDLNGYDLSLNKDQVVDTENATVTTTDNQKSGSVIEVKGEDTSLTITDKNDDADYEHGEGTGTISGGYVQPSHGAGFGGGIKVDDGASLDLQGGTITNNVASNGGGVYVGKGSVTMSGNATIDGNLATMGGGGVYLNTELASRTDDEAVLTMNGGTISNNTASGKDANGNIVGGGGGIGTNLYAESPDPDYDAIVINGGTITGNKAEVDGAGIYVNNGKVSIKDSNISGNTAAAIQGTGTTQRGGGIYANGNKTVVKVTGSTISGNSATWGGGIYINNTKVTMTGNSITGNKADQGGGIYAIGNTANVTMTGGSIANNTADKLGGGVRLGSGVKFTMNSGSITGNTCSGENYGGGGVYSYLNSEFIMNGGEITGNTAANGSGGGVFNHTATFIMNGGKLYGNSADKSSDDIFSNTTKDGRIELIFAKDMGVMEGNKNVSQWMLDVSNGRWRDGHYEISDLNGNGTLRLKAAHDEYFNVTYRDDEKVLQTSELEKGSEFPTCQEPTREGYTFAGWNLELPETVNGNIVLTAKWDPIPVEPTEPSEPEEPSEPTEPEEPVDPEEPEEPGVAIPDPDVPLGGAPDADTVDIEDEEVPLAGIMSMAQLLEELRVREEIADVELPEDFKFMDHDYAQAIFWALSEELVADTEEEPLDPDEIVTVGLMRKVLNAFAVNCKGYENFTTAIEGEDDEIVMDLGARLNLFYEELEQYEAE